jgi:hypothetical protein
LEAWPFRCLGFEGCCLHDWWISTEQDGKTPGYPNFLSSFFFMESQRRGMTKQVGDKIKSSDVSTTLNTCSIWALHWMPCRQHSVSCHHCRCPIDEHMNK